MRHKNDSRCSDRRSKHWDLSATADSPTLPHSVVKSPAMRPPARSVAQCKAAAGVGDSFDFLPRGSLRLFGRMVALRWQGSNCGHTVACCDAFVDHTGQRPSLRGSYADRLANLAKRREKDGSRLSTRTQSNSSVTKHAKPRCCTQCADPRAMLVPRARPARLRLLSRFSVHACVWSQVNCEPTEIPLRNPPTQVIC